MWCEKNDDLGTRIKETLLCGISYDEGVFKDRPHEKGLLACQAIFAFYNGQKSPTDNQSLFSGLLGGYSAYERCTCTRLVSQTAPRQNHAGPGLGDEDIVLAISFRRNKLFVLDSSSGRVFFYSTASFIKVPAVPLISDTLDQFDSALIWLEEYAGRLEGGYFKAGEIVPYIGITEGILLFPSLCTSRLQNSAAAGHRRVQAVSRAVTRGVEVIASSVFTPEFLEMGLAHIYSIRIRLLTQDESDYASVSDRGFETCQLRDRHWHIRDDRQGKTDRIDGPGVIGYYPLFREGGYRADMDDRVGVEEIGVFAYQSCSGPGHGSFWGSLSFVPGSRKRPTGDIFEVEVAPFALDMNPPFLY